MYLLLISYYKLVISIGLVSNLNESNSQSSVINFQLSEAEKSRDKLKNHLKQMKNDKNYYREQEKSKRYIQCYRIMCTYLCSNVHI